MPRTCEHAVNELLESKAGEEWRLCLICGEPYFEQYEDHNGA